MGRPPFPEMTPVTRPFGRGGAALIPIVHLVQQVQEMDRVATWALQQAINLQQGFDDGTVEENKYHVNKFNRLLQLAAACGGAINSKLTTFKFIEEVNSGQHTGGDQSRYDEAKGR